MPPSQNQYRQIKFVLEFWGKIYVIAGAQKLLLRKRSLKN